MRRSKLKTIAGGTIGLALATAGIAAPAGATHSGGSGPNRDMAHGRGHFEGQGPFGPTDVTMQFSAMRDASGEVKGRFFTHRLLPNPELHINGEVTCLNVVGNSATIGGRILHSKQEAAPVGSGVLIQVVDFGEGSDHTDQMQGSLTATPPTTCPAPPASARLAVQQGNFTVHDAPG